MVDISKVKVGDKITAEFVVKDIHKAYNNPKNFLLTEIRNRIDNH